MDFIKEKHLVIKQGVNKKAIRIVGMLLVFVIMLATSNLWLPDGRAVADRNLKEPIAFNGAKVKLLKGYYYDSKLKIGEIRLEVTKDMDMEDFVFSIALNGNVSYPKKSYEVIKGSELPMSENGTSIYQEIVIQFAMPQDDFYYLSVMVDQKGNRKDSFDIDYRSFKEKKLSEKGKDYVKSMDDLNIQIITLKGQRDVLKKEVQGYQNTFDQISTDMKQLQAQLKITTDEAAKKEKEDVIQIKSEDQKQAKKLLKEKKVELKSINKKLEKIQNEKQNIS